MAQKTIVDTANAIKRTLFEHHPEMVGFALVFIDQNEHVGIVGEQPKDPEARRIFNAVHRDVILSSAQEILESEQA